LTKYIDFYSRKRFVVGDITGSGIGTDAMSGIFGSPEISAAWEELMLSIEPYQAYIPFVLIALGAIILFMGRRFFNVFKFIACFVVGYVVGAVVLTPMISTVLPVEASIIGISVGVLFGVLSQVIYVVAIGGGVGLLTYTLVADAAIAELGALDEDGMMICLGIAVAVTIIAFVVLKYFEMGVTAIIGAYLLSMGIVSGVFDFTLLFPGNEILVELIAVVVIALIGFIVQVKTRKRY
jgi:hypothetical protein